MKSAAARSLLAAASLIALAVRCPAQTTTWHIDPGHSEASLSLESSTQSSPTFNVGIGQVSGTLQVDDQQTEGSVLDLNIYPAGEDANLIDERGDFRRTGVADLPKYTLIHFRSRSASAVGKGRLEFTGEMTVTHVIRAASLESGQQPVTQTTTHKTTIEVQRPSSGPTLTTAVSAIKRRDFPGFWEALWDSVWPVAVEDKECHMPPSVNRDYNGAICTGKTVKLNPSSGHPSGDEVTIRAHLTLTP